MKKNPIRVLVVSPGLLPTTNLNAIFPLKNINRIEESVDISLTFKKLSKVKLKHLYNSDVIWSIRNLGVEANQMAIMSKFLGKPYIFDIDDSLGEIPLTSSLIEAFPWNVTRRNIAFQLEMADMTRVYSKHLLNLFADFKNVFFRQMWVTPDLLISKNEGNRSAVKNSVNILYPGANKFSPEIFKIVSQALLKLSCQFEITYNSFQSKTALAEFEKVGIATRRLPYARDLILFYESIGKLDNAIGIAPLENSSFYASKTPAKFRDLAICGVPGVFSKVPPYTDTVIDRKNGLLVNNSTEGWFDGLKKLIENTEVYYDIKWTAQRFATETYDLRAYCNQIIDDFDFALRMKLSEHQKFLKRRFWNTRVKSIAPFTILDGTSDRKKSKDFLDELSYFVTTKPNVRNRRNPLTIVLIDCDEGPSTYVSNPDGKFQEFLIHNSKCYSDYCSRMGKNLLKLESRKVTYPKDEFIAQLTNLFEGLGSGGLKEFRPYLQKKVNKDALEYIQKAILRLEEEIEISKINFRRK